MVENTGIIVRKADQAFLGSCFIYRYPGKVLTAHHCIRNNESGELGVVFPGSRAKNHIFSVLESTRHPTADVAALTIEPPNEREITWPLTGVFDDSGFGLDVCCFGFPQEWVAGVARPLPRMFKGHVQRLFENRSHLGYRYVAAELSFTCPAGLSGSPIINPQFQGRLYGIVTENVRTSTEVESVLEVDDNGERFKESFHRILSYGVALWLPQIASWLDNCVAPIPNEEINRRGQNQHLWKE